MKRKKKHRQIFYLFALFSAILNSVFLSPLRSLVLWRIGKRTFPRHPSLHSTDTLNNVLSLRGLMPFPIFPLLRFLYSMLFGLFTIQYWDTATHVPFSRETVHQLKSVWRTLKLKYLIKRRHTNASKAEGTKRRNNACVV